MNRVSAEGQAKARSVWSACGLPPLSRARKREQARRTPNAAARYQLLAGSWSQCAVEKPWRLSMNSLELNSDLSLVTGDLQRSGPSVSQCPITSYQLPVTSLMGVLRLVKDDTAALRFQQRGEGRGGALQFHCARISGATTSSAATSARARPANYR